MQVNLTGTNFPPPIGMDAPYFGGAVVGTFVEGSVLHVSLALGCVSAGSEVEGCVG